MKSYRAQMALAITCAAFALALPPAQAQAPLGGATVRPPITTTPPGSSFDVNRSTGTPIGSGTKTEEKEPPRDKPDRSSVDTDSSTVKSPDKKK